MNSKFLHQLASLASGTIVAQLILISATPIITRLYEPSVFGLFAVAVSVINILAVVSSGRYNRAIPLPKGDSSARQVVYLSLALVLIFTCFISFVIFLSNAFDFELFGLSATGIYIWIIPLSVLVLGIYDVFSYWALRIGRFKVMAFSKILQALTTTFIQIALFSLSFGGLIIGFIVGQLVAFSIIYLFLKDSLTIAPPIFNKVIIVAKRYKDFPKFSTWEAFANSLGNQLPIILFAVFYGPAAAAFFALTYKVLNLPMTLIGGAISQVFFSNASKVNGTKELSVLSISLLKTLCGMAFPAGIALYILGPAIFKIAFGDEWLRAGEYVRYMSPWLVLVFITSPLSPLISIVEKQRQGLYFQIFLLVVRLGSLIVAGLFLLELNAVLLFSLANMVALVIFLFWLIKLSGNRYRAIAPLILSTVIPALIINSPLYLLHDYTSFGVWMTLPIAVFLIAYFLYITLLLKNMIKQSPRADS